MFAFVLFVKMQFISCKFNVNLKYPSLKINFQISSFNLKTMPHEPCQMACPSCRNVFTELEKWISYILEWTRRILSFDLTKLWHASAPSSSRTIWKLAMNANVATKQVLRCIFQIYILNSYPSQLQLTSNPSQLN